MKKICTIILSLVVTLLCIFGIDSYAKIGINKNIEKAIYYNMPTRNSSDFAMDKVINDKSVVVLGSSELSASDELAYPPSLFHNGKADFNMVLVGEGHRQCLPHAINVGALQNNVKNRKIVLILSPQWFTKEGLDANAFSSKFEETNYVEVLENDNISKETKKLISNRVNELLAVDPATLDRVKLYQTVYLDHTRNPITNIEMKIYSKFRNSKVRFELANELKKLPAENTSDYVKTENIDFGALLSQAEQLGVESCTTNNFGIYDEYYNTYIKEGVESSRNSNLTTSYATSKEYDDFKLFLEVCKETGIEPLIISVPVNGRWYDYTGFSKVDRNTYYQNIRNICEENGVELVDFADKEYEKYFLKDIMHLGWKGWVYLDSAVYNYYKGEEISTSSSFDELKYEEINLSKGTREIGDMAYSFSSKEEKNTFNSVIVSLAEDDITLDIGEKSGNRSGVFLHTKDSGMYKVRVRANSNIQDEDVELKVFLEKGSVYKILYNIEVFEEKQIDINELKILKVEY